MFLSLKGVATRAGLSENTIKAYFARGYMPAPDVEIGTGEKVTAYGWSPETVDTWLANRPGRGARTDLQR
ncbi:MAG: transcriptional regulator [Mobiluncus sp.]|uniref:Transcriptional regulator n=1 Tax=Mobiluncus porci TaxID=2652278 RepID=A0A7K0K383_9ACTO|nr:MULTISPECIES: transcriptional regulator [Mobiluncus]MCI6584480.1 transcriptional regulator [Mobiluncus sp.]MST49505.1 transcriptional regulator [Mobiluncus porci]